MNYFYLVFKEKLFKILTSSKEVLLSCIEKNINNKNTRILTFNPEMLAASLDNTEFYNNIKDSDYIIPDGIGLIYLLKLKGIKDIKRVAGIDLAEEILQLANKNKYSLALIGAGKEVLFKTQNIINKKYPSINIVYAQHGYYSDEDKILNDLENIQPEIIFCALSFIKQEALLNKIQKLKTKSLSIGLGGSFDVWAGNIQRAPIIFQRLNIEWLWRIIQQPHRIKRLYKMLKVLLLNK